MNFMTFHSVGTFIIPTDDSSYFSEGYGSTTNQVCLVDVLTRCVTRNGQIIESECLLQVTCGVAWGTASKSNAR